MAEPRKPAIRLRIGDGDGSTIRVVKGRDAWAFAKLFEAGEKGCTPIERPAPRWSHYVFKLRRAGLSIETIDEPHGGPYAGSHARYVLRSPVTVIETTGVAP